MNWLDLVLVVIMLWAVRSSLEAGLIQELFTLLGLVAGILVAGRLYAPIARALSGQVPREVANAATFLAILVAVWFVVGLLGRLARQMARKMLLGWADRLGGVFFGLLKGLVLVEILLVVLARFPIFDTEDLIRGSLIASWVSRYVPVVIALLPSEFQRLTTIFRR